MFFGLFCQDPGQAWADGFHLPQRQELAGTGAVWTEAALEVSPMAELLVASSSRTANQLILVTGREKFPTFQHEGSR